MPHRNADPQSGQRARLGQGLADQQVRVLVHQTDRRFTAEVDIGFIHQHHGVRVGLEQTLDRLQGQPAASRRIGVGEDNAAVGPHVIVHANLELLIQRHLHKVDAIQAAVHRVEAVADIRKQQRLAVLEQAVEGVRQHLVGTVTDKYLSGLHAVIVSDRLFQAVAVRVRVQAQVVIDLGLHGGDGLGRRTIGVFVGVELDQLGQFRLLTWHIRHQVFDEGAPEFAHLPFSPRI